MSSSRRILLTLLVIYAMAFVIVSGSPILERSIGVCLRNCAQCKQMFGPYFSGQKCADTCVKFKGKPIPDCEVYDSIEPYLQRLEGDY